MRLREATLDDAEIFDERAGDPEWIGEFNDFGLPPPPPLAENLANGKRMVTPERGQLLIERLSDGAVIGDISWHPVSYGPNEGSRALNIGLSLIPRHAVTVTGPKRNGCFRSCSSASSTSIASRPAPTSRTSLSSAPREGWVQP